MEPRWYADPRLWLDATSVLVTGVFSALLYVASMRAAAAAEGATQLSKTLYEERLRRHYYERSLLLYQIVDLIDVWTRTLHENLTQEQKLMKLRAAPPFWDERGTGASLDSSRLMANLLRILREYQSLMKFLDDSPKRFDDYGNLLSSLPEDQERYRRPLEDFEKLAVSVRGEAEILLKATPVLGS